MQTRFKPMPLALALLAAGAAATTAPAVMAQGELEEVVITGLRGAARSAVDSAVPVDTFNAEEIQTISHSDTVDILQTLVPSFNVNRQPISDGASVRCSCVASTHTTLWCWSMVSVVTVPHWYRSVAPVPRVLT